jgi:putative flippase GtrA
MPARFSVLPRRFAQHRLFGSPGPGCRTLGNVPDAQTVNPAQEAQPGLVRRLVHRFRDIVHELGKFGVVGVVSYVVDTGLLNFLLSAHMNPLLAKTISTVISATVAFAGNRFWTWRHRPRSGLRREYTLYFLFNIVGLAIGLACLGISHYALGSVWPVFQTKLADLVSANVVGMAFGTLFRFWSYRRFVFKEVSADEAGIPRMAELEAK